MESHWPSLTLRVIAHVEARLRADPDRLTDAVVTDICRVLPGYAGLGDPEARLVREGVRFTVLVCIDALAEGRALSDDELAMLMQRGAERAAQGLSLEAMCASVHVAMRCAWKLVVEAVEELPANAETTAALAALHSWFANTERAAVAAMTEGERDYHKRVNTDEAKARRRFAADLLAGAQTTDPTFAERAAELDYDLSVPYGLVLLAPHGEPPESDWLLRRGRLALTAKIPTALEGPLAGEPGEQAVIVVPISRSADWTQVRALAFQAASAHGLVAVAMDPGCARDLPKTCERGKRLADLARQVAWGPGSFDADDLGFFEFVNDSRPDLNNSGVRRIVDNLTAAAEGDRRDALEVLWALFLTGYNAMETARLLGVTRGVLRGRIAAMERVTGCELDDFKVRLRLELAIHCPAFYGLRHPIG